MNSVDTKTLIDGCLSKDKRSEMALFKKYFAYCMSIAYRYARNKEDAEWLVNESFVKVFANLVNYDPSKEFRFWLRRILINTIINHNQRFTQEVSVEEEELDLRVDHGNILGQMAYDDILKCIQELSVGYRTVLNLYLVEGYKHHEIAEMLNISEGTSKSNLFKGKALLKKKLEKSLN